MGRVLVGVGYAYGNSAEEEKILKKIAENRFSELEICNEQRLEWDVYTSQKQPLDSKFSYILLCTYQQSPASRGRNRG